MQNLTTKEPDDGMIEVAIQAVETVFDWRQYLRENFPETEIPQELMEDEEGKHPAPCQAALDGKADSADGTKAVREGAAAS